MSVYILTKSNNKKNKFSVSFLNDTGKIKTISFGQAGASDFTQHKDLKRKLAYLRRHINENWRDPHTKGFWARWLLWHKDDLNDAIKSIERLFNLKIFANIK